MYSVEIKESSRDLNKKERVALKTGAFEVLDRLAPCTLEPTGYAILHVTNDEADNTEYDKFVIFAADGKLYATGSEPFFRQFKAIFSEMDGEEDFTIEVVKQPSRKREGKYFLSCNII